jgi:hypothetical protein
MRNELLSPIFELFSDEKRLKGFNDNKKLNLFDEKLFEPKLKLREREN